MVTTNTNNRCRRHQIESYIYPEQNFLSRLRFLVLIPPLFVLYNSAKQQLRFFNKMDSKVNLLRPYYDNAMEIKEWRESTQNECQSIIDSLDGTFNSSALDRKEEMEARAVSQIYLPESSSLRGVYPTEHHKYEYCKNTFIDLGTNIGDSIGYFVDNSIDVCTPMWVRASQQKQIAITFPRLHLDVTERKIIGKGSGRNPLMGLLQNYMDQDNNTVLPENTCVYGMEGNPAFTERLQKLESFILGMRPRPGKEKENVFYSYSSWSLLLLTILILLCNA